MPNSRPYHVHTCEEVRTVYVVMADDPEDAAAKVIDSIHEGTRDRMRQLDCTAAELDVEDGVLAPFGITCSWCNQEILGSTSTIKDSHGICPRCHHKHFAEPIRKAQR